MRVNTTALTMVDPGDRGEHRGADDHRLVEPAAEPAEPQVCGMEDLRGESRRLGQHPHQHEHRQHREPVVVDDRERQRAELPERERLARAEHHADHPDDPHRHAHRNPEGEQDEQRECAGVADDGRVDLDHRSGSGPAPAESVRSRSTNRPAKSNAHCTVISVAPTARTSRAGQTG